MLPRRLHIGSGTQNATAEEELRTKPGKVNAQRDPQRKELLLLNAMLDQA